MPLVIATEMHNRNWYDMAKTLGIEYKEEDPTYISDLFKIVITRPIHASIRCYRISEDDLNFILLNTNLWKLKNIPDILFFDLTSALELGVDLNYCIK